MSLYDLQGLGGEDAAQVMHSGWSTGGCAYQSHIDTTCNSGFSTGGCYPTN